MGAVSGKDLDAVLATDEFTYQPLDLDWPTIRVVQIHPGPPGTTVECTLKHIDLEESHVCLSYKCGESDRREWILVNGKRHSVLPNLFKFLNKARELGVSDWLWIDAISIHQTDLQERNRQVQQMANIYRQACHTFVWLGEFHHSDLAVIGKGFEPFFSPLWKQLPLIRRAFVPRWTHICQVIVNQGYFDRVWIIQEILISKKLLIILGNEFIPEQTFRHFFEGMFLKSKNMWSLAMYQARSVLEERARNSGLCPLTNVIGLTSRSKCSEPCDRLFGVLGLVSYGEAFPVDYTKPLAELQLDAIEHFLPAEGLEGIPLLSDAALLFMSLNVAFGTECTWLCKQCSLGAQADSADVSARLEPPREDINAGHILAQANPVRILTAHISNNPEGRESWSHWYLKDIFCRKCRQMITSKDRTWTSEIIKLERLSLTDLQLTVKCDVEAVRRRHRRLRNQLIMEEHTRQRGYPGEK